MKPSLQAPEVAADVACELGESPLWIPEEGLLAWLDIEGRLLHRLEPDSGERFAVELAQVVTAIGLTTGDELVAATQDGFGLLDPATGVAEALPGVLGVHPDDRMNDGAVAPDGSFWAGSMVGAERAGSGKVWRLVPGGQPSVQLHDVTISNGLDWYPDDALTMLYVDSQTRRIDRIQLSEDARVVERAPLADIRGTDGEPDGLAIDAEGTAWVAVWGAGEVRAYDRRGRHVSTIAVPAANPSSCVFGGDDLATLFITTAREDLDHPTVDDGRLYACRVGAVGQGPRRFGWGNPEPR